LALAALHGAGRAGLLVVTGCVAASIVAAATISRWSSVELFYLAVGASMGAIFPLVVALTAQRFPHARGTSAGLAIGVGSTGGFAVPWLTGALGDASGVTAAVASLAIWPALIAGVAALRCRARGAR
jgi:fucose permease